MLDLCAEGSWLEWLKEDPMDPPESVGDRARLPDRIL